MNLPDEINQDLIDILGRPNFTCANMAEMLRLMGQPIPKKAEHEQAHVILWLLSHYAKAGAEWRKSAEAEIDKFYNGLIKEKKENDAIGG